MNARKKIDEICRHKADMEQVQIDRQRFLFKYLMPLLETGDR